MNLTQILESCVRPSRFSRLRPSAVSFLFLGLANASRSSCASTLIERRYNAIPLSLPGRRRVLSPVCHPFLGLAVRRRATRLHACGTRGIKTSTQPIGNQSIQHHSIMKQQVFLFICAILLGGAVVWVITRKDAPAIPLNSVSGPAATQHAGQAGPPPGSPDPSVHRTQAVGPAARNGEQE